MGTYLNCGNSGFRKIVNGLYVDKTGLIEYINQTIDTAKSLTCVSRPRRFGKSFAAKMLCAYYDKSCDSRELFEGLEISRSESFEKYLNKLDVLYLDISWFISISEDIKHVISNIQSFVIREIKELFPDCIDSQERSLPVALLSVSQKYGNRFFIIIDEWDALFREARHDESLQKDYLMLLRGLFKSGQATDTMLAGAYMTGILPIKKYGTQSALTDFKEYTMVRPLKLAEYVGFTEPEVRELCNVYQADFEEMQKWYDGYSFSRIQSVYSPNSVVNAIENGEFGDYWTETETYESLKGYIGMNLDGLKDAIIAMLGGERIKVYTRLFQNDMKTFNNKDDVLTLLVHLGYLAYDSSAEEVYIPNQEIADEFENAIVGSNWQPVEKALTESEELLKATIDGNSDAVAEALAGIHASNTSILAYNNENSLSCAITIAYYTARKDYTIIRELPSGKGFADMAFIPRRNVDKPALLIELKYDKSAEGAIRQIREQRYDGALSEYADNLLLVGIDYDKKTKRHSCMIEKFNS